MRIVFMGTPNFSVPCLSRLADAGHDIAAVFTQPDKPKGRGFKLIPTPVKIRAAELGIPVYQPASLRKGADAVSALDTLKALAPEIIVVVAYGQILPRAVLAFPQYGCVNIHASLLPEYRGAAPIQRAILDGRRITGVTSMQMEEGLDTGDMLLKAQLSIGENETGAELHDRLSLLGAEVLVKTLDGISAGTIISEKQDDSLSSYAAMITKEMSALDFSRPAFEIHNTIRAISGFAFAGGRRIKIYRSELYSQKIPDRQDGELADCAELLVKCGDGYGVFLRELQAEGGKRMSAEEFLRGSRLENGMILTKASE